MPIPAHITWKKYRRHFRKPLLTGAGKFTTRDGIVFRIEQTDGTPHFGEIAPWPGFGCETLDKAELCLIQGTLPVPAQLPCTAAAFSMARLRAKSNLPATPLRVAALLSTTTPLAALATKRAMGFSTFKFKITANSLPMAQLILEKLQPNERLRLDANASLNSLDAWLEIWADERIEFLEQPLPHNRMTQRQLAQLPDVLLQKLALDESVAHAVTLPNDWPGILIIKPLLLGDWDAFRHWRNMHPNTSLVYSSCFETAIGREAILHLATEDVASSKIAHGLDTLGQFENDAWAAHADGITASILNQPQDTWEAWWQNTPGEIFSAP
ncbi:MAG: o-succinylbenzoate synthase [Puniceicoccales bacterium]|jgi:o-succinylbenzoate synthase|nr:o-succinylbenzoate synthase [Puniceicoccales bacterium]